MEVDTIQIAITTPIKRWIQDKLQLPYGGGSKTNYNYNSHMEVDTRQITTPIWRWIQDKLQLQLPYGGG